MIQFSQGPDSSKGFSINMLPLVDIIFNLLIFFLITATISTKGINLDLPRAVSAKAVPAKSQSIVLNRRGEIFFNETRINLARLPRLLEGRINAPDYRPSEQIVVKAHKEVPFGLFISVMDLVRKTGFENLVIATDPKPVQL